MKALIVLVLFLLSFEASSSVIECSSEGYFDTLFESDVLCEEFTNKTILEVCLIEVRKQFGYDEQTITGSVKCIPPGGVRYFATAFTSGRRDFEVMYHGRAKDNRAQWGSVESEASTCINIANYLYQGFIGSSGKRSYNPSEQCRVIDSRFNTATALISGSFVFRDRNANRNPNWIDPRGTKVRNDGDGNEDSGNKDKQEAEKVKKETEKIEQENVELAENLNLCRSQEISDILGKDISLINFDRLVTLVEPCENGLKKLVEEARFEANALEELVKNTKLGLDNDLIPEVKNRLEVLEQSTPYKDLFELAGVDSLFKGESYRLGRDEEGFYKNVSNEYSSIGFWPAITSEQEELFQGSVLAWGETFSFYPSDFNSETLSTQKIDYIDGHLLGRQEILTIAQSLKKNTPEEKKFINDVLISFEELTKSNPDDPWFLSFSKIISSKLKNEVYLSPKELSVIMLGKVLAEYLNAFRASYQEAKEAGLIPLKAGKPNRHAERLAELNIELDRVKIKSIAAMDELYSFALSDYGVLWEMCSIFWKPKCDPSEAPLSYEDRVEKVKKFALGFGSALALNRLIKAKSVQFVDKASAFDSSLNDEIQGAINLLNQAKRTNWKPDAMYHVLYGTFQLRKNETIWRLKSGMHTWPGLQWHLSHLKNNGEIYNLKQVSQIKEGVNVTKAVEYQVMPNGTMRVHLPRDMWKNGSSRKKSVIKIGKDSDGNAIEARGAKTFWARDITERDIVDAGNDAIAPIVESLDSITRTQLIQGRNVIVTPSDQSFIKVEWSKEIKGRDFRFITALRDGKIESIYPI